MGHNGDAPKSILVTSAHPGEGKTSFAVSLALSFVGPGSRVLLIDGDIHGAQVARLLKVAPPRNLQDLLKGDLMLTECVTHSRVRGLDLLVPPARNGRPREPVSARAAARIVAQACELYDHVIIDSPPVLGAADALVWAHVVDGVVISTMLGASEKAAMTLACQRLGAVNARVLGVVMSNVPRTDMHYSCAYTSMRPVDDLLDDAPENAARRSPPVVTYPDATSIFDVPPEETT